MNRIKQGAKDPKTLAIVALLGILGVTNADTAVNMADNLVQVAQPAGDGKPPEIKLEGPDKIMEGDLIVFDAMESYGDHFKWLIEPKPAGDESLFEVDEHRRCVVASKPGVYILTLFVSNCEGSVYEQRQLVVESNDDCPEPDDPIKPEPDPDVPSGKLGLIKAAHDLAISKVTAGNRSNANKLATVYESLSKNQSLKTPQALVSQTSTELKSALGASGSNWQAWYASINEKIKSLQVQGRLPSVVEFRVAWSEIAEGLKAL